MKPLSYVFLALLLATPAHAESISLGWPVACTKGQDCWIVHLVDRDPAVNASKDYMCGHLTYDGHDGTDIAVKDRRAMENHVAVLAAAGGTVLRGRNTAADGDGGAAQIAAARSAGQECGNGVVISHGNGWETQYCHMKQSSIVVRPGQQVHKGDRLGDVGQSGMAEFPHLHFTVRHNGAIVDPFASGTQTACGSDGEPPLWDKPVPYDPVMIYAAGLSAQTPDYKKLLQDASQPSAINQDASVLTFWTLSYGLQTGDHIDMKIFGPDGAVYVQNEYIQITPQIRAMHFISKETSKSKLHPGNYTGKATLTRIGSGMQKTVHTAESVVTVTGVVR